ncbi:hypothetical protein Achl_1046 [Pseudarthrobacter chlorophenolicus A6]|uniref:Uncharacterized protein n=1 Tax=Pseudarthrobacter chlorophenolicus (strain ATCC 700700 / DSM 12829 / CIP 107037 / JCM 12360 / KCTC 9906 / NCIMB 13794 / A6) TaxID=452863 RepID=B8HE05_PSECP|nr:hypothetical protein [Pseudarthrobacter chlorophenolicus]ACL39040.1 hypothetical protein Achl_1046 [Pseudarthrobacter chlorophenolicus A6]SDR05240.1 hypothetical protein SAMN04489738_4483 [Pseudarthrobacter chlorophenolicus]
MSNNPASPDNTAVNTATGKLALGWALVGVPLAYGVYETLTRVAALFG